MKNSIALIAAVLLGVLLMTNNAVSTPLVLTHQGRLMNGATPANGFFDIEYDIYPTATGGTSLWTETHTGVECKDGFFDVELGTINGFFDVFTDEDTWLEIKIVGEATPISPRTRMGASPYSVISQGVVSSHPISGSLDTAKIDIRTTSTGASLRISTKEPAQIEIPNLRMTGNSTGANFSMTGDPDFDLLRLSADADSAKIRISGQSIGDPDFDLLRLTGGGGVGEIKISGDPDFDLLRLSANADSAEISMSGQVIGDPDFDLLRMIGNPKLGEITMKVKNSIGNIRGITTEVDSATASFHQWTWASGSVKKNMIELSSDDETGTMTISNGEGTRGIITRANNSGGSIAIGEEGVQKIKMDTDSTHVEIAIGEEGVQITMRVDSGAGGSFAINEPGVGKKVSLDSDGDGYLAGKLGIGVLVPTHPLQLISGAHVTAGGTWTNASDKDLKENFEEVNGENLLEKIESLDISEWNYKNEADDIKHIGPTAQDFYKAFGVGGDDKSISTVDPSGIALAAIKELYKKSKEVDELKKQLEELTKAVEKLAKERK